jgi:hypothetical protein
MIAKTRAPITVRLVIAVALVCVTALTAATVTATAAPLPTESLQAYEAQLANGQVRAAVINLDARSIHLTLTDGTLVLAHYGPGQEATVIRQLRSHGIIPTTPKGKALHEPKPHKHKIRYIAGAILIVLILIVLAVLLVRRRRAATADY